MADKRAPALPAPPADLASRPLPLVRITGLVYRIHRVRHSAIFFGKAGASRFDDPLKRYGVLYAALNPEGAFAEVFLRQLDQILIEETAFSERLLSPIRVNTVSCVDLTGEGLRRISCDNRIATEAPYCNASLWSRALFEHPRKPAGIVYRSRHNPRLKCVAIFSTFASKLKLQQSRNLFAQPLRTWTIRQIDRYHLSLLPAAP